MPAPNHIPLDERVWSAVFATVLLAWGSYGIYVNDLVIPLKRRRDIHLHDEPALLMFGAFLCGAMVLISVVVDHYDRRNNEHKYEEFAAFLGKAGWALFVVSLVLHFGIALFGAFNA